MADLDESERAVVYYAGLLAWVGCHTHAYGQAKWFGDDIRLAASILRAIACVNAWDLAGRNAA